MSTQHSTLQDYQPFDGVGRLVELHRAALAYVEEIQDFMREYMPDWGTEDLDDVLQELRTDGFRVAVVGRMNSGKSTFLNAFCGQYVSPVNVINNTVAPIRVHHDNHHRAVVWFFPEEDHPQRQDTGGVSGAGQTAQDQERSERLTSRLIPFLRGGARGLTGRQAQASATRTGPPPRNGRQNKSRPPAEKSSPPDADLESQAISLKNLRDYVDYTRNKDNEKRVAFVDVGVDGPLFQKGLILIDSPGIGGLNRIIEQPLLRSLLGSVDAALLVYSSSGNLGREEMDFLLKEVRIKARQGKVFVVQNGFRNSWDDDAQHQEKMDRVRKTTEANVRREYEAQRTEQDPERFEVEILPVDAAQAWKGIETHRPELLEGSGLPGVQAEVERYLQHKFGRRRLHSVRRKLIGDLRAIRAASRQELGLLERRREDVQDIRDEFDVFRGSLEEEKNREREAAATAIKKLIGQARKDFLTHMSTFCTRKKNALNNRMFTEINARINRELESEVDIWSARNLTEPGAPFQRSLQEVFDSVERPLRKRIEVEFARINEALGLPVEKITPSTWDPKPQALSIPEFDVEVGILRRMFDWLPIVDGSIGTLRTEIDKAFSQIKEAVTEWTREVTSALKRSCRDSIDRLYRQRVEVTRKVFVRVFEHLKKERKELDKEKQTVGSRVAMLDDFLAQLDRLEERIDTVEDGP